MSKESTNRHWFGSKGWDGPAEPDHDPTGRRRQTRQRGFLLLEVLIAFVIMALSFGVVLAAGGSALQSAHLASRYQEAALRAQSHLEEAVNGNNLMPGEWQGEEGARYAWRVRVTQSPLAAAHRAGPAASLTLYNVDVWVTWRDGLRPRDVHLQTERIAEAFKPP